MTKNLFLVTNLHVYDRHKRFVCAILLRVQFAAVINLLQTLSNVLLRLLFFFLLYNYPRVITAQTNLNWLLCV